MRKRRNIFLSSSFRFRFRFRVLFSLALCLFCSIKRFSTKCNKHVKIIPPIDCVYGAGEPQLAQNRAPATHELPQLAQKRGVPAGEAAAGLEESLGNGAGEEAVVFVGEGDDPETSPGP